MPCMRTWGHLLSKGMILLLRSLSLHMMNILPRVLQFVRFFRGSQGDRLSHFTLFLMQIRTLSLAMKYLMTCMLTCDVVAYMLCFRILFKTFYYLALMSVNTILNYNALNTSIWKYITTVIMEPMPTLMLPTLQSVPAPGTLRQQL